MMDVPTHCERCGRKLVSHTMSMFNTQIICIDCKDRERSHHQYEQAVRVELEAVQRGDLNFPGIGLPPELQIV